MTPVINCIENDLSADAALRVVIVEDTGELYFDCVNVREFTFQDIVRLLIGLDEDENFAWRVSI
jgi:hypothetical protein